MTTTVHQRGSALIISLLILIVMTLIGLTGITSSTIEEKMAGNTRDQALSFQAAEAALRGGENYIKDSITSTAKFGTEAWLYPSDNLPNIFDDDTWATANSYSGAIDDVNLKEQPLYVIELLGEIPQDDDLMMRGYGPSAGKVWAMRITARAVGGTDNTVTILQSNFAKVLAAS